MKTYQELANTVIISTKKNRLLDYDDSLELVGTGRSAFAFRIKYSNKAIKIFFPDFIHVAKEEAEIYNTLQNISYFPTIYESGQNYIVMDFIEGRTLYDCINHGVSITTDHINEIDAALLTASNRGLNPSDIHLRNIIITPNQEIKLIDVARFRQTKDCTQWHDLKLVYHQLYLKRFFPKKIPTTMLNIMAFLYKKHLLPSYLSSSKIG
ncbi:AarF/UbiB family protein [Paenisporosarcina sp. TG-14]|uniref:AarF/UbiB family protein n=1 Tax=Paenisporosarcina sp. TG-14 TaxID=1231057 RepID=UPI000319C86E|nr:AarF/UbiB family protein [Paenisporosarcina sp. TG-14]